MDGIAISLNADVHRLKSKFHDSSDAATEWYRPHASAGRGRVPVCGEDGLRGQVPALFHVVVDEVLQQHLIDVRTASPTGDRPDVVDEYAQHEMAWHHQSDDVGPQSKLSLPQVLAGRSRQLNDRACAPNHLMYFPRGEQKSRLHVPQPGNTDLREGRRHRKRLVDDGSNPANDQVPVVVNFQWNHRLNI